MRNGRLMEELLRETARDLLETSADDRLSDESGINYGA